MQKRFTPSGSIPRRKVRSPPEHFFPPPKLVRRLVFSLFAAVLIGGLIYLWASNILRVNVIRVTGADRLATDSIISALPITSRTNMLLVHPDDLIRQVKQKIALVDEVEIKRTYFPNSLEIIITEKKPVLAWHTGTGIYAVDENGIVAGIAYDPALIVVYAFGASLPDAGEAEAIPGDGEPGTGSNLPELIPSGAMLEVGESVADGLFIRYVLDLAEEFRTRMATGVDFFQQGEHQDLTAHLSSGITILFSSSYTIESEMKRLEDTLSEAERVGKTITEYVDLRFEKVYFK